jgi:hypothetical protein
MGITMATPVIALGSLPQPEPARRLVRTVEVKETFQHGEETEENSLSKRPALRDHKQDVIPAVSDFLTSLALIMVGEVGARSDHEGRGRIEDWEAGRFSQSS